MNLSDLANHICTTVRKTDADSLDACKGYLKRRDQMLWDGYLWRDSLFTFTVPVDPTAAFSYNNNPILATSGMVLLPKCIDRVLGLRTTDRALPVENVENLFRGSLDMFAQTGTPWQFELESPVVYQFDTAQSLYVWSEAAADVRVTCRFHDTHFGEFKTGAVDSTSEPVLVPGSNTVDFIEEITKPESVGSINFGVWPDGDEAPTVKVFLTATETAAGKFQRIRLTPIPTAALTLRVLAKKKYQPLTTDEQEPRLRQAENVLIALAMGDMLRRSRQFGKATSSYEEGMGLLMKLADVEFHQQAQRQRIVPVMEPDPLRDRIYPSAFFTGKGFW
jgi:hypothetical protein